MTLSVPKMLSGANVFEISDIQEERSRGPVLTKRPECSNVTLHRYIASIWPAAVSIRQRHLQTMIPSGPPSKGCAMAHTRSFRKRKSYQPPSVTEFWLKMRHDMRFEFILKDRQSALRT